MSTVEMTPKQQEEEVKKLTSTKKKLKLHILREAKAMRKSRNAYYEQPTLFDYALEDAGLMHGFFSRLEEQKPVRLEKIIRACTYFLIYANCEAKEKEELGKEMNGLQNYCAALAAFGNLISEKTFYYEELWEKLEEIGKCRGW